MVTPRHPSSAVITGTLYDEDDECHDYSQGNEVESGYTNRNNEHEGTMQNRKNMNPPLTGTVHKKG